MFENLKEGARTISPLVSDIVDDARKLFAQEAELARAEIREEIARAASAGTKVGLAAGFIVIGCVLAAFALVHLAVYLVPDLPLWGAFGAIAILFLLGGAILFAISRRQAGKVSLVPRKTMSSLKENASWLTSKLQ